MSVITSCFQVTEAHIDEALRPPTRLGERTARERVFALLERMAEVSAPRQGAAKVLLVFARIAACDWVEGQLEVRVTGDGETSTIDSYVDDGLSLQRFRPALVLRAPYDELARAVALQAKVLLPLQLIGEPSESAFVLRPSARAAVDIGDVIVDANEAPRPPEPAARPPRKRPPSDLAKTVQRAVPLPPEARRPDAEPPAIRFLDDLDRDVDDGWEREK